MPVLDTLEDTDLQQKLPLRDHLLFTVLIFALETDHLPLKKKREKKKKSTSLLTIIIHQHSQFIPLSE